MKRPSCFYTLIILCNLFILNSGWTQQAEIYFPQRIILNLTDDPAHSEAVTWRTMENVDEPQVEISIAIPQPKLEDKADKISAVSEKVEIGADTIVFQHSAILKNLQANTLYAYRVGDGKVWSEWNQFRTAKNGIAPFKFVYFGDPQNDIIAYVSRIFREAYKKTPDAAFWLFTGDMVSISTSDDWWGELFYAAGFIPRIMPSIELAGNHSYPRKNMNGKMVRSLAPLWRPHFTLPENGPADLPETAYYIDYQGVRFIMLNGNEKLQEQASWLEDVLANNPNPWTIVAMHQPIYSTGKDRDNPQYREYFLPLYDKYHVDLVLQGHDHSYGRTFKLRNGQIVKPDEKGTIYIVSVSGPKMYNLNPHSANLMAKYDTGEQLFQVIDINGNHLQYESWTATGELYDSFELKK